MENETTQYSGRPTKYKPEYCQKMIDFFSIEHTKIKEEEIATNSGVKIVKKEVANSLPTFERFAVMVDVVVDTLHEWKKVHTEFSEAYKKCQHLQKDMLADLAQRGLYNATFSIFTAKNITDWRDKIETDNTNRNLNLDLDTDNLSDEELVALKKILTKAVDGETADGSASGESEGDAAKTGTTQET